MQNVYEVLLLLWIFFLFYMRGSAMTYYIHLFWWPQEKKADSAIEEWSLWRAWAIDWTH